MATVENTNLHSVLLAAVGLRDPQDIQSVELAVAQVKRFKELQDALKGFEPEFKEMIFAIAEKYGVTDEKGNATLTLADGTGYKKEVRQSVSIDQEAAVELFRSKGLGLYVQNKFILKEDVDISLLAANLPDAVRDRYFDKQEVVKDEEIETAFLTGKITDAELQTVVTKKIVNALKEVKPKAKKK
jgi:hypothetical protein